MELLQQLQTQVIAIWNRWNASQRIGFAIAALLCLIGIGLIGSWATQQEFVALERNLSVEESRQIIAALEAEGIDFQQNQAGSMVLVPVSQIAKARMAASEYISPVADSEESSIGGMWMDPLEKKSQAQRMQEKRLAASIAQIRSVKSATVHISQADDSPFLRQQKPAKASIVLDLVPGGMFSSADARGIISLVSHSVQNLNEADTIIVDTSGRVLSAADQGAADTNGQLAYRKQLETDLAQKAEAILIPLLGPNMAVIRVSLDIDFTRKTTEKKSFDPELKVKSTETIESESSTGGSVAGGAAGTASNVGGGLTLNDAGGGTTTDKETITTNYENSEINDVIEVAPGAILRVTVAATVQLPAAPEGEAAEGAAPFVPVSMESVEELIKQAVGFSAERKDQITVVAGQFLGMPDLSEPVGFLGLPTGLDSLLRSASLGIAAIVALIIGWMTVKKLKPVLVEVDRRKSLSPEVRERLATLTDEIRERPDAMSTVLTTWMEGVAEKDSGKQTRKAA